MDQYLHYPATFSELHRTHFYTVDTERVKSLNLAPT
jgi:hypothetical protein